MSFRLQLLPWRWPKVRDQNVATVSTAVSAWSNFTPLLFSPSIWLDASDSSTITELSGSVSQWNDKSGNGRNATQGSGVLQPSTGTATINGINALSFNSDYMVIGSYTLPAGGFTTFAVATQTTNSNGYIWENAGSIRYFWRSSNALVANGMVFGYTDTVPAFRNYSASYPNDGLPHILMGSTLDSNAALRVSPTQATYPTRTGLPGSSSRSTNIGTNASGSASRMWLGNIGEILIFDYELVFSQQIAVYEYLRLKWLF